MTVARYYNSIENFMKMNRFFFPPIKKLPFVLDLYSSDFYLYFIKVDMLPKKLYYFI